jgi:small ligand-binding sensory domain FIST
MERAQLACRIGTGLSTEPHTAAAAAEAARTAGEGVRGEIDLAFVFASPHHADGLAAAVAELRAVLEPGVLVGCIAEGVVAGRREIEEGPAIAVWAGSLPGAELESFHAAAVELDDGVVVSGFPDVAGADVVALIADPYSFPAGAFLARLDEQRPGLPVVGGLATAGDAEARALVLGDEVLDEGAVGVAISGVPVRTVVSQGCAAIGREAVITGAEDNVVHELAGTPALERLREEIRSLSEEDRALAARGILAGLVIDENKAEYGRGDYLVRALIGVDEESGALAIGEHVRVGQTLRFHVRDAARADADLREALGETLGDTPAAGALMFTCNGRGTRMFTEPNHDAGLVAEALGGAELAGFFCGGEIGPVGGRSFLHGFTATLAVFLHDN